jgi:hypothetical protein
LTVRRTHRPRRVQGAAGRAPAGRWPTLDPEIQGDLDDFAHAIDVLSPGDYQRLIAFWETVAPRARDEAHERAQAAAIRTGRRDVIHSLQEELIAWGGPSQAARTGSIEAWLPVGPDSEQYDRRRALPALLDTALALTVQDELDDADFETLFGPWRDAMGDGEESDDGADADAPAPPPSST